MKKLLLGLVFLSCASSVQAVWLSRKRVRGQVEAIFAFQAECERNRELVPVAVPVIQMAVRRIGKELPAEVLVHIAGYIGNQEYGSKKMKEEE